MLRALAIHKNTLTLTPNSHLKTEQQTSPSLTQLTISIFFVCDVGQTYHGSIFITTGIPSLTKKKI